MGESQNSEGAVSTPVLEVRNLHVHYFTDRVLPAVNGVDFTLRAGERMGLVGESGSGKSTMALALMRMIKPPGRIVSGEMQVDGVNLSRLREDVMGKLCAS